MSVDPILTMMAGAIAALWAWGQWSVKGRTERCEAREDKLLSADIEKTAALKELTTLATTSAALTDKAIDMITGGVSAVQDNGKKLDQAIVTLAAISKSTDRVEREIARRASERKSVQ